MKSFNRFVTVASMGLALVALTTPASMAARSQASALHVTKSLDVGGTILEPGDYVIHLDPSNRNRNILRVTNADGTKVITTVLSIPHALGSGQNKGDTSFVYYPTAAGAPQALRTWFASDSTTGGGHDIVYPRSRAMELAAAAGEPVHAYVEPATNDELVTAEIVVVTPDQEIVPFTSAPADTASEEEPMVLASATMPQTAGALPLFGVAGLLLLAAAIGIHVYRIA